MRPHDPNYSHRRLAGPDAGSSTRIFRCAVEPKSERCFQRKQGRPYKGQPTGDQSEQFRKQNILE
jgi:hypothetical protein